MIITRTPFRITLGGGGTDLPAYYEKYGGFIFSAGINQYMFVTVSRPAEDNLIRLKYRESECVEKIDDLKHPLAREILRHMGINHQIEISSVADVSARTGLGSSSCYAVGVLNALHALKREHVSLIALAEEDFAIEVGVLKRPIGKQDPYLAALGGLTVLDIGKNGTVFVRKAGVSEDSAEILNRNMMVFFTGVTRDADGILKEQAKHLNGKKKEVVESMHYIKELGYKILDALESDQVDRVGALFDEHWEYKKKISQAMSNPKFDAIYQAAKEAGALGGKISGAGGGGFFTFYVPEHHNKFRAAMKRFGLRELRYRFDFEGSKVLVDF